MILQQKRDQELATRDPGGEIRISQSSLNTGERALYWEEDDSAVTITSGLKDENTLKWAEALTAYEAGTIPLVDPAETQATRIP